jgi:hypothetical protein
MTKRNNSLPAVFLAAGLVVLAGCTGMNGGEAVTQAAPVPPPPGDNAETVQQETEKHEEDLPDRVFAPLDDAVNVINRDMNREIDKDYPENETSPAPAPGN